MDLKQDMGKHMLEYIQQNYRKDISLDDMAENLNVSPKYCSALFKKQTGQTFKKVLNEYRIEQAKQILRQNPEHQGGGAGAGMLASAAPIPLSRCSSNTRAQHPTSLRCAPIKQKNTGERPQGLPVFFFCPHFYCIINIIS